MFKSWRTTIFGAGGLLTTLAVIASALFDGDPDTVVNWAIIIPSISTSVALLFARDNAVSSEKAGAKK